MKITNYQLLCEPTASKLTDKVKEAIGQGWQPLGSVAVTVDSSEEGHIYFAQAMVKSAPQGD